MVWRVWGRRLEGEGRWLEGCGRWLEGWGRWLEGEGRWLEGGKLKGGVKMAELYCSLRKRWVDGGGEFFCG